MVTPLYKFADEASAQADPVVGSFYENGAWRGDVCLPNVQVWDPMEDITNADGTTSHVFAPGFYIRIAGPVLNTPAFYPLPAGWGSQPDFAS